MEGAYEQLATRPSDEKLPAFECLDAEFQHGFQLHSIEITADAAGIFCKLR